MKAIAQTLSVLFAMVLIFIRERFCWLYDGDTLNESLSIHGNKSQLKNQNEAYLSYETIYGLLWCEKMRNHLKNIINDNQYHWMIDIIIEFCYGLKMNNNDITDIKMWDNIMFENENFEYQMIVPHIGNDIDIDIDIEHHMMNTNELTVKDNIHNKRKLSNNNINEDNIEDKGCFASKIIELLNES